MVMAWVGIDNHWHVSWGFQCNMHVNVKFPYSFDRWQQRSVWHAGNEIHHSTLHVVSIYWTLSLAESRQLANVSHPGRSSRSNVSDVPLCLQVGTVTSRNPLVGPIKWVMSGKWRQRQQTPRRKNRFETGKNICHLPQGKEWKANSNPPNARLRIVIPVTDTMDMKVLNTSNVMARKIFFLGNLSDDLSVSVAGTAFDDRGRFYFAWVDASDCYSTNPFLSLVSSCSAPLCCALHDYDHDNCLSTTSHRPSIRSIRMLNTLRNNDHLGVQDNAIKATTNYHYCYCCTVFISHGQAKRGKKKSSDSDSTFVSIQENELMS